VETLLFYPSDALCQIILINFKVPLPKYIYFFPFRVMSVPATIIYFTAYDQLKIMYGFKPGEKNIYSPVLSGITARGTI
jgi:hypothetical protein